jgi:hypothetical protein
MRLPRALDEWFTERLARHAERSPSELLVQLVHGGLRLREGYMAIHHRVLEGHIVAGETESYAAYVRCLTDTFGTEYVAHLETWLKSELGSAAAARIGRTDAVATRSATAESSAPTQEPIGNP